MLVAANVSFAIRSGGHAPFLGAANINNGILIDMSKFNNLTYDEEKEVAVIGTGMRWGEVYEQLGQYHVAVVGGRVPGVGVGGLILGGGLSWLTDLYGLACDNVVNFEVVTADGSLINANAKDNKELFWALKGGGNNFGIVTKFSLKTYPLHQVWGGNRNYAIEDLPAVFNAMHEYQSVPHKDPYANMIILASPTDATIGIALTLIYLKPQTQRPSVFDPFYRINSTSDNTGPQTFSALINSNPLPNSTIRFDWAATSALPNKLLYQDLANIVVNSTAVDTIRNAFGFFAATFQPISSSAVKAGYSNGGNALGLDAINQTWIQVEAAWPFTTNDVAVHAALKNITDESSHAAELQHSHIPYIYMNDAGLDEKVITSYGERNVRKLKQVQKKYDPQLVFQRLVPGYFKLPLF
ncbi:hypothetical protein B0O99DRAFT_633873 [Bisporella sp. PMI_857]|nr:hypothetical protein B0O99DRAFT_633873 [Bisporella sp. PMI_857]